MSDQYAGGWVLECVASRHRARIPSARACDHRWKCAHIVPNSASVYHAAAPANSAAPERMAWVVASLTETTPPHGQHERLHQPPR